MEEVILIKYGELTTKGDNRYFFIDKIYERVCSLLDDIGTLVIKKKDRMFILINGEDKKSVIDRIKNIFGIHSIVLTYRVQTNIGNIMDASLECMKKLNIRTFKVEAKRCDKNFPLSSMELAKDIGAMILKSIPNLQVDVHNPEFVLKVEVRGDYSYIYQKEIMGLGGYPVGALGSGLLMLSGGIDSPVSGYLAMKRGIRLECVYFESPPHTSLAARDKVISLVKKLSLYQPEIKLHIVHFTDLQEAIYKNIKSDYMITIMRRMMYRISEKIMREEGCYVLINGESIGQVASQTLTSMQVINSVTNVPVIRPVACFDKLEIIDIARRIDTYEISILPYEDCCTIFLPKHPVINPDVKRAIKYENQFDYQMLVDDAVNSRETLMINKDYKKFDF